MRKIITSESVNIGHPDKTCDYISDAFLDEALEQDKDSQMAVECAIKNDKLFIYGEATTKAKIDYDNIAKTILKNIGYKNDFKIIKEISNQSPDINQAVVKNELCANDQGMVYGYATNETKEYMPLPIVLAHKLMMQYEKFRKNNEEFFADAKSQVSVCYDEKKPIYIDTILISVSHSEKISIEEIKKQIIENVINNVLLSYKDLVNDKTKFIVNPSGKFTIWGSFSDSGCVGRKIVVDTYGGAARHGGGAFSGKDPSKVDRSAAYMLRYIAKNIVAADLCDRIEIQVSYAIGVKEPTSVFVETYGSEHVDVDVIIKAIRENFDLTPGGIIKTLNLRQPIYQKTAAYGHFGRGDLDLPWEKLDKVEVLKKYR